MRLGQKQELFYRFNHHLDEWILSQAGVEIRGGELWRPNSQAIWNASHCRVCKEPKWWHSPDGNLDHKFIPIGIKNSNHCRKLASDKNIFVNGVWVTRSVDLTDLGEYWEKMSTDEVTCCWGGRFKHPDGNHFSFLHGRTR